MSSHCAEGSSDLLFTVSLENMFSLSTRSKDNGIKRDFVTVTKEEAGGDSNRIFVTAIKEEAGKLLHVLTSFIIL